MYSQVNDLLVSKLSHWIHGFKLKHTLCSFWGLQDILKKLVLKLLLA
jgi:hypothetical protein